MTRLLLNFLHLFDSKPVKASVDWSGTLIEIAIKAGLIAAIVCISAYTWKMVPILSSVLAVTLLAMELIDRKEARSKEQAKEAVRKQGLAAALNNTHRN